MHRYVFVKKLMFENDDILTNVLDGETKFLKYLRSCT